MAEPITRRRAMTIMAAAAGLPLISFAGPFAGAANAAVEPVVWKGQALGAPATLILNHPDPAKARTLVARVVSEVDRLESVFSLYRQNSALAELNRLGALAAPPGELVVLLETCHDAWKASQGAFDPSVQPLWSLYARHFSTPGSNPAGPSRQQLDETLPLVDFSGVRFNRDRIALARPGMALTLNGIAQGYITDRVVELLQADGITSSLVSMGESRAIGAKADGGPWHIGLGETEDEATPDTVAAIIDRAVATSSANGFHFDAAARFGHILDPRMGSVAPKYRRMTVIAPNATTADAYSTAFSLLEPDAIRAIVDAEREISVDLAMVSGERLRLGRPVDIR
ncbi:MAG: FAD:protein FMN transferase [Arenimonas sp.]|nr:FAD:protein FMN transferase [Rhizobium sp.]MBW8445593.1 FAD:protein FMN transferase [Arenimonas sp.]